MSKQVEKILRLAKEGKDAHTIAKRLGYKGGAMTAGIEKVKKTLTDNKIKI